MKEDCIFIYGAVTLYGRPFQTVLLTLSYPSFNQVIARFARLRAAVKPLRGAALMRGHLIIVVLQPRTFLANRPV